MVKMKAILTIGITIFFVIASLPVSANTPNISGLQAEESSLIEKFMNKVEQTASESTSYEEFLLKISTLCDNQNFKEHPFLKAILRTLLSWIINENGLYLGGRNINDLLNKYDRSGYFVISYGSYNRLNPKKENAINLFKERLSFWHYGGKTQIFKGKTLIIERRPFEIKQKVQGPQFGMMKDFQGLYFDYESKLTGNSYVFFIGHAHRIRAFSLHAFSSE